MKLGFLRPLYDEVGDYLSVYLDTDRAHENAEEAIGLRWRAASEELARQGASPDSLAAVHEVIDDPGEAAPGRAVFARDGVVAFTGALDAVPRREIARLAPLPHVMPLLAQHRPPIPHLRVSATREGGEIVAVGATGGEWRDWVAGRTWPVHKTKVGGWSQPQHQRSVEETWQHNARVLAAEVIAIAGRSAARHAIIAGDVRARSLLLEHLPVALRGSATVFGEEVTADSHAMAEAADRALLDWADRDSRVWYDDWKAKLAHGLAVEGLAETLAAFRDGQVSDLFLADDPSSVASAWIGPSPGDIAVSQQELLERGVEQWAVDRADAAIARAVARTGSELHFLPGDVVEKGDPEALAGIARPRDGICAIIRYPLAGG